MGSRKFVDLTGKRFGELEIIEKDGVRGKNVLWKCFCHGCKKECHKVTPMIRSYSISCGCLRTRRGKSSPLWQGVGEISKENWNKIIINAKRRKINCSVTLEDVWELFQQQQGLCALSKRPLTFGRYQRGEVTASLDRIDSSKPYEKGNIQWVHKYVNIGKHSLDQKFFIDLCKDIAKYN